LDFAKAYEKVSWEFLFVALEKMGMARKFYWDGEIVTPKC
jgi:hypothetical protein